MATVQLGVLNAPDDFLLGLQPALQSILGPTAPVIPADILALTPGCKPTRDAWMRYLGADSVVWPAAYEKLYAARSGGKRTRLTKHEVLLDLLSRHVHRIAGYSVQENRQKREAYRTQMFVWRVLENTAYCQERNGLVWPYERQHEAWAKLKACQRPDCNCFLMSATQEHLEQLRRMGRVLTVAP